MTNYVSPYYRATLILNLTMIIWPDFNYYVLPTYTDVVMDLTANETRMLSKVLLYLNIEFNSQLLDYLSFLFCFIPYKLHLF
jgi:hypothetical protein